jgi:uncharacterized protein (TIGR02679 family)
LRATFGDPDLDWLVDRVRARLARGAAPGATATLAKPTPGQRAAVDRLLGRPPTRGGTLTVRLDELDRVVRHAELAGGFVEAVQALVGPVGDEQARRAATDRAWSAAERAAVERVADRPGLTDWLDGVLRSGLVRRLAGGDPGTGRRLLGQALGVIERLPAPGVPLAELAATATGDSHALDAGAPVGTLAVRAAATLGGVDRWDTAEARRDAWTSVGVLCDELSVPALTLNLRGDPRSVTGRALAAHAETGEPYRLSTRQLLRDPFELTAATVFVCENPTVVAAAANRLGMGAAPMVCIEGQVRTAARLLLDRLAVAGTRLVYHGDFDWAGLRIANGVIARWGSAPWRMSASDYQAAVVAHPTGAALTGSPVAASWDAELAAQMRHRNRAIHEEAVLATLLADLTGS